MATDERPAEFVKRSMGKRPKTPCGVSKVLVMEVIKTTGIVGDGTMEKPYALVDAYWSLDGELLAVRDYREDVNDF